MLQKALLTFLSTLLLCASASATNYREDSFEYYSSSATSSAPLYTLAALQRKNIVIIAGEVNIPIQYTGGESFKYNSSSKHYEAWEESVSGLSNISDSISTYIGDFDGDGNTDLLLHSRLSSAYASLMMILGGAGDYPSRIIQNYGYSVSGSIPSEFQVSIRDQNSDGIDDVIITSLTSTTSYLYREKISYGSSGLSTGLPENDFEFLSPEHPIYDVQVSKPSYGQIVPGGTIGSFKVNESGSAVFSLPLYSPKGPAGMNMGQTLTYSSSAPNGVMGLGWSLENASVISVCPTTTYFRDFTGAKSYCLNGSRLVKLQTSTDDTFEYLTPVSDLTKITADVINNVPQSFELLSRDGSHTEFKKIAPEMWVVDKIWNATRSAYLQYDYLDLGTGTYKSLPAAIEKVSINTAVGATLSETIYAYESREDVITQYFGGEARSLNNRLKQITVKAGAEVVRTYHLSYDRSLLNGRSRLRYIQECGLIGQCFEPLEFDWNTARANTGVEVVADIGITDAKNSLISDFNGDGYPDILIHKDNKLTAKLGNGDGTWSVSSPNEINLPDSTHKNFRLMLSDIDLDGISDVLVFNTYTSGSNQYFRFQVYKSNEASTSQSLSFDKLHDVNRLMNSLDFDYLYPQLSDVNGDGRLDVVFLNSKVYSGEMRVNSFDALTQWNGPAGELVFNNYPNVFDNFFTDSRCSQTATIGIEDSTFVGGRDAAFSLSDIDGDGYLDALFKGSTGCPWESEKNAWIVSYSKFGNQYGQGFVTGIPVAEGLYLADINADGNVDIHGESNLWINKGNGKFSQESTFLGALSEGQNYSERIAQVDLNSDGLVDFFKVSGDSGFGDQYSQHFSLILNLGADYSGAAAPPYFNPVNNHDDLISAHSPDINNDGIADLLRLADTGKLFASLRGVSSANTVGQPVDVINKITYSNGSSMDVTYSYTKGEDASPVPAGISDANVAHVDGPKFVVSKVEEDSALPDERVSRTYQFKGARFDYEQFGFLGFRHITVSDSATGVSTVTEYAQEFPYIGMPLYTYRYLLSSSAPSVLSPNIALADLDIQRGANPYSSVGPDGGNLSDDFNQCRNVINDIDLSGLHLVSCARNILNAKNIATPERHELVTPQFPFIETTIEEIFHSDTLLGMETNTAPAAVSGGSNNLLKSIITNNEYAGAHDSFYGEVSKQVVFTSVLLGDKFFSKKVVSDYEYAGNNVENWWLGRLTRQSVTTTQSLINSGLGSIDNSYYSKVIDSIDSSAGVIERVSEFDYYPETGLLKSSTTDPESPNLSIHTEYVYDTWGNRTDVTKSSHAQADADLQFWRKSTVSYDENGIYADGIYEYPYGEASKRLKTKTLVRNTLGLPTSAQGANGTIKDTSYDGFGRLTVSTQSSGASSTISYQFCLADSSCPAGVGYMVKSNNSNSAPASKIFTSQLGHVIRSGQQAFDGSWVYTDHTYDVLGRRLSTSIPHNGAYLSEEVQASYQYDVLNRVVKTTSVEDKKTRFKFNGLITHQINSNGYTKESIKNGFGQEVFSSEFYSDTPDTVLKQVSYKYNAASNQTIAEGDGSVIATAYNLLGQATRVSDSSKGEWFYKRNALHEVINQQNANADYVTNTYDDLGRKISYTVKQNTSGDFDEPLLGEALEQANWVFDSRENGIGKIGNVNGQFSYGGMATTYAHNYIYNSQSQLATKQTTIDAMAYHETWLYDNVGRVWQYYDASNGTAEIPTKGVEYHFNQGYTVSLSDVNSADVYYTTEKVNNFGKVTEATFGNGVKYGAIYDSETGRLSFLTAGKSTSGDEILDYFHQYNDVGLLNYVNDSNLGYRETFAYDDTYRLLNVSTTGIFTANQGGFDPHNLTLTYYDGSSNLKTKSTFENNADYIYAESDACPAVCGPNQLTSIGDLKLYYDNNGNRVSETRNNVLERDASYTSYDKPWHIAKGAHTASFAYGAGHERIKQVAGNNGVYKFTHYVGGVEWNNENDQWTYKRRIAGNVIEEQTGTGSELLYLHRDYQGSVVAITNKDGVIQQRLSYDVYGQRRDVRYDHADGFVKPTTSMYDLIGMQTYDASQAREAALDSRGYTNHEHLDGVNLIHMNGRVFDPLSAVFMSADPFVQDMSNQYSFNRYSYTYNNPVNYTDPSGYFSFSWGGLFGGGGGGGGSNAVLGSSSGYRNVMARTYEFTSRVSAAVAISVFTGGMASNAGWGWTGAAWAAGGGYASTYAMTGSTGQSEKGALFALATFGAGEYIKGAQWGEYTTIGAQSLANGAIAGIQANMAGGNFETGFYSAGLSTAAGSQIGRLASSGYADLATLSNIVMAGFVSHQTGGSFAMGATTAAFSMTLAASMEPEPPRQEEVVSPVAELEAMNAGSLQEEIVGPSALALPESMRVTETETSISYRYAGGTVTLRNDVPGNGIPDVSNERLMHALDISVQEGGANVVIVSGYRSPVHNTPSLNHRKFQAIDLYIDGYNSTQTASAMYRSGYFTRTAGYPLSNLQTAHGDNRTGVRQGCFVAWGGASC